METSSRDNRHNTYAASTVRAYGADWQAFTAWCRQQRRIALPAAPETVAEYVRHLIGTPTRYGRPRAPATVGRAIAGITTRHAAVGHPVTFTRARLLLEDYRTSQAETGTYPRSVTPISPDDAAAMVAACRDEAELGGARDRVIIVLGFALMSRRSELAGLDVEDLEFADGGMRVRIADENGPGQIVEVPVGPDPATCPVRLSLAWLDLLAANGIVSGPLLRGVDRYGRLGGTARATIRGTGRMTGTGINAVVRRIARAAGLTGDYTVHSLRAGAAGAAVKRGTPAQAIAYQGRWRRTRPELHGRARPRLLPAGLTAPPSHG